LNRTKTDVMPAELWQPDGFASLVDELPCEFHPDTQLPRPGVRAVADQVREAFKDPHEAALHVADRIHRFQADLAWVIRKVTGWCDGTLPADVHDQMALRLAEAAMPPDATDDPACGLAMLSAAKVDGSMSRAVTERLIEVATTDALPPRAQASASWLLASRGRFSPSVMRGLETRHRIPARATLAAAHLAGETITATQAARCIN
jgi:hypothetical protein